MNSRNYKAYAENLKRELEQNPEATDYIFRVVLENPTVKTLINRMIDLKVKEILKEGKKPLDTTQARICPDCGGILNFNSYHQRFSHQPSSECVYEENIYGECVWNNSLRDQILKEDLTDDLF